MLQKPAGLLCHAFPENRDSEQQSQQNGET